MKTTIAWALLMSVAVAQPAFSADEEQKQERKVVVKRVDKSMEDFDANKDGKISKKEFAKGQKKRTEERFEKLDKDGDGYLSEDERVRIWVSPRAPRAPRMVMGLDSDILGAEVEEALAMVEDELVRVEIEVERSMEAHREQMEKRATEMRRMRFERLDEDKDGKLSREEYMERRDRQFADLDKNNDGFLSEEELQAHKPDVRRHRVIVHKKDDE